MFNPSEEQKQRVRNWRDAAIADGWSIEATYGSESVERAARLKRDSFLVSILTREPEPKPWHANPPAEYSIFGWGPDGLALELGETYDWEFLNRNLLLCGACGKYKPKVVRVCFCNRVCEDCEPKERARLEKPGWSN